MSEEVRGKRLETILRFTDLIAWQKAHHLAVSIYRDTLTFPHEEHFGLTSQLRRAAVSITSNIAEGFGRHTYPDRVHFYDIARGSLIEVQSQLILAKDVGYLSEERFTDLIAGSDLTHKILMGLIATTRKGRLTSNLKLLTSDRKEK